MELFFNRRFNRREEDPLVLRDVQSELTGAILRGAEILPSKKFTAAIYSALHAHREISIGELDELANRISRLAWQRGRG